MKITYFLCAMVLYSVTTHAMEQAQRQLMSNTQMSTISITNNASPQEEHSATATICSLAKPIFGDSDYEKWFGAIEQNDVVTIDFYTKQCIDVNRVNKNGETPLYWAACYGHKDIIELLLKAHADVNQAAKDGVTPLYWAAFFGYKDIAELLLKANANVNQENKKGQTALYRAAWCGHKNVVELLVAHNAVIDQKTINKTRENRHEQIAQYLELCSKNLQRILCR